MQVQQLARKLLCEHVRPGKPDQQISLSKACMLIALEEEAAAQAEAIRRGRQALNPWLDVSCLTSGMYCYHRLCAALSQLNLAAAAGTRCC